MPAKTQKTKNHEKTQTDILIAGGGAPGLVLAALLGPLGLRVTVIDPAPFPGLKDARLENRTSAMMQGSINIVRAAGAWDDCVEYGAELQILRLVDENTPPSKKGEIIQTDFHAAEIGLPAFAVNMPNSILRAALCDRARQIKQITLLPGRALASYDVGMGAVTAHLDDGTEITANLIVGADGRGSKVREIAQIPYRTHDFKQAAITCLLEHSQPHDFISTEFHRPTGPFTLVPLPGNMASVVWVDYQDTADEMMKLSRPAFEQALQERSRNHLGSVKMVGTPSCWPLIGLKAKKLIAPRVALVAEAAHVLHPLGAQGLNLSLRDVAVLAETIADAARLGLDIGSMVVLQNYAKRRAADIHSRVYGTEGLNHLVSNNKQLVHNIRRAGLRMVGSLTPLRNLAMQQGLAPYDGESRLLAGGAL